MKFPLRLLFVLFLPIGYGMGQTTPPTTYTALQAQVADLPDTVRFERLSDFCRHMQEKAQFDESARAIPDLMRIAQRNRNQSLLGRTYMVMGYQERGLNKVTPAIDNFQRAQVIFGTAGQYQRQIRALQRIDNIYVHLRELTMAEKYCLRALQIARQHKLEGEVANLYTDLATIADIRKNYTKALDYNEKAIQIYRARKEDYSATLFNRGIILKNAGRYQESIDTYAQCLAIAQRTNDHLLAGMVYVNLPNTLLLLNRADEAERYIRRALKWARQQPQSQFYYQYIYETLTDIYQKRGQYQQALAYHKQWVMYRDSLFNAEKSRQLIEIETRYQTREKQQQILQLDADNLRKKQQVGWLVAGIALLVLLLGMMAWQYRTIRRMNQALGETNQTLSQANQRISQQAVQLKELMKELHHRVKNNLAIVSSLLYLQSNRLEDENAIRAVRDGQQRVEAMSLIHQQLYQTDNVTLVSMPEYIGDLVHGLMQSFSHKDALALQLDIDPIEVDVEMAVPLGLIINELVTNVFKHAFRDVAQPQLSLRLWTDEHLFLEVKDNGPGVDIDQWQKPGRSFGKRLIQSLTKQVGARLEIHNEGGTCFRLIIPPVPTVGGWKSRSVTVSDSVLV
ncbi:sensor histidine kinase [Larkinella insperata]|uniref:histidine kinase n=1 Tax=Larkinella insperata TaxID=332158 RepID=A0ABW3QMJ7_9BACT|nr:histidine kinase dimerization/phosphoacceptor domain -containing protein [Larkinella insperata]